jgi:hypothetical protein
LTNAYSTQSIPHFRQIRQQQQPASVRAQIQLKRL